MSDRQIKWRDNLKHRGLVELKIVVPASKIEFFKRLAERCRRRVEKKESPG